MVAGSVDEQETDLFKQIASSGLTEVDHPTAGEDLGLVSGWPNEDGRFSHLLLGVTAQPAVPKHPSTTHLTTVDLSRETVRVPPAVLFTLSTEMSISAVPG